MQYDFSLDGTLASSMGIILQKPASVSELTPRYIKKVVPKYGTYHIFDGYEDRKLYISAYILSNSLISTMNNAYAFLLQTNPRAIVLYQNGAAYYSGTGVLLNGGEIDIRARVLNSFTAVFEITGDS